MRCIGYATAAVCVFVDARAMKLGVHSVGEVGTGDYEWLRGINTQGKMQCNLEDECISGSGMGSCTVMVDVSVPIQLGSTDSGYDIDIASVDPYHEYPAPLDTPKSDITFTGKSESSHWNICWKHDASGTHRTDPWSTTVDDYCFYVNGLCFLWASPCSGGCSQIDVCSYAWFCPQLRYATEAEFSAALPTLNSDRSAFFQKCAATVFDPYFWHCDYANDFVRVPDNHWNELVLVCPPTLVPTPAPTQAPTLASTPQQNSISATGDPHLQNVHGERFDLMMPGKHVLIQIPKGELAQNALLRVQADARRLGGQCADLYFQELNITGEWAEATQIGGLNFNARKQIHETPKWVKFGKVQIKVAHGHTDEGIQYLNCYVKHLGHAGYDVGGLLGEDDHKEAAKPSPACVHHTSLLQLAAPSEHGVPAFSIAEAGFA